MRFAVDYDRGAKRRPELHALEALLNERLIGLDHGRGLTCLFVDFVQKLPRSGTLRCRLLQGEYVQIRRLWTPTDDAVVNLRAAFDEVVAAARQAADIDLKIPGYALDRLLADLANVRQHLPRDPSELSALLDRVPDLESAAGVARTRLALRLRHEEAAPCETPVNGVALSVLPSGPRVRDGAPKPGLARERQVSTLLTWLVHDAGILAPGYGSVQITVAGTLDAAMQDGPRDDSYALAFAALAPSRWAACAEPDRTSLLLEVCLDALESLAANDHWDLEELGSVRREVEERGVARELVVRQAQKGDVTAAVLFSVDGIAADGSTPYRLRLQRGEEVSEHPLAEVPHWNAGEVFGSIKILRDRVEVRPRKSAAARFALENAGITPPLSVPLD